MNPPACLRCDRCGKTYPQACFTNAEDPTLCRFCAEHAPPPAEDASSPAARFTLFGFSEEEKGELLLHAVMLQSLARALRRFEPVLAPLAYDLSYSSAQQLIRVDVLYWLHHADKQGSKLQRERDLLLKVREVACDWLGRQPPAPEDEYKLGSKARSQLEIRCVERGVPLSQTQLVVLSALLSVLADPNSVAVAHKFFPRGTLLRANDLALLREHRELLEKAAHYSCYAQALRRCASLHFLALDEAFAETRPAWDVMAALHFPLVLSRFALRRCLQLTAMQLLLPLAAVRDAARLEEVSAVCATPAALEEDLETMASVLLKELVTQVSRELYRWCKRCAANRLDKALEVPSRPQLDVMVSGECDE